MSGKEEWKRSGIKIAGLVLATLWIGSVATSMWMDELNLMRKLIASGLFVTFLWAAWTGVMRS